MNIMVEAFFGGCISKVINDGKDFLWVKIKKVINDKNDLNLSTKIYRIIEKTLNIVTHNNYINSDILYEAIEKIFNEFKNNGDTLKAVKCGLQLLCSDINEQSCENFLDKFYEGICQDEDLHNKITLILQINSNKISQEGFRQLNELIEGSVTQLNKKIDKTIDIKNGNDYENISQNREPVKSRTQEYADKWNANMFLNNFDKRDENGGVNVKLRDVYLDKHLPHYIWGNNKNELDDLKGLLTEYVEESKENKMLIILGQPGIGKSTLITWITANFTEKLDDILVYQFASDLKNVNWHKSNISKEILNALNMSYDELSGKTLILEGFDEISIETLRRRDILDNLYGEWIYKNDIKNITLIITCRENYIHGFERVKCNYITLKAWNDKQIRSFCNVFQEKTKNSISGDTINKLVEKKEILGIPLILYMILALKISIEKEGSVVDIYDRIFSLEGGIYDRCIDYKKFADSHRISEIKEQIHQVSRDIAIWMFENNPDEAYIPQEEYMKICVKNMQGVGVEEQDFIIGNFYNIKHCEGGNGEKLFFVHRSIYEYFVVETIYSSIENSIKVLLEESQEELASNIAIYLKQGEITYTVGEYLLCKIHRLFNELSVEKKNRFYRWWEETVAKMMEKGMFYYTNKNITYYENIISKECQCFKNIFKILRLFSVICNEKFVMGNINRKLLEKYIKYCLIEIQFASINNTPMDLIKLDFNNMDLHEMNLIEIELKQVYLNHTNLSGANLMGVNLKGKSMIGVDLTKANLNKADLAEVDLSGANLIGANLKDVNLEKANLEGADLRLADLTGTNLTGTNLDGVILDESSVRNIENKYNLESIKVYINSTCEIIAYEEYFKRKGQ